MRSMMFGEEATAESPKPADTPTVESAEPSEPVAASSQPSWSSHAWGGSDETSASVESEPTPSPSPQVDESATEAPVEADSGDSSFTYDAWKSSQTGESESESALSAGASTVEPAEADSATPERSGDDAKPGAGTVVIIEDDSAAASYYSTLFKGNGYQVEVANDGVSGVDLCTRVQPQVILLDVMMPRQNGILVLQTLRASDETKNTPVVVMSNFSEPTLIKRALQLGALEYVIKTQVEGPALLNALPRWMNREKAFAAA
jgi:CheY-like chemotaxis protein